MHVYMEGSDWDMYADWCKRVLDSHGESVYDQLADAKNYKAWLFQQKSEDRD